MGITTAPGAMTSEEIAALLDASTPSSRGRSRAPSTRSPSTTPRASTCTRPRASAILDFNSQLMSVNIGHGDRRVIDAITAQATKLQYVQPAFATEIRARLGAKLAEILPGDMDKVFFTLGGAEAIENAIKLARARDRPAQDPRPLPLVPRRDARGDDADRRPAPLGERAGHRRRRPLPGHAPLGRGRATSRRRRACRASRTSSATRAPSTIAAVFLETIVGTNGILIPPDGYIAGVREICDRNDILMVADEVMAGFGRTGRWFAVDHWDVTPGPDDDGQGPDLARYLPLGAVAMRHAIAEKFENQMFYGGLTYSSHPVSLAAALATIGVYEEDGLIENAARLDRGHARAPPAPRRRAPERRRARATSGCSGSSTSSGSRDPWTPLTPFNGTSDEMKAIGKFLRENGAVHDDRQQLDPHQPAAVHHRGRSWPRASRSSTRALDIADQAVTG